MNQEAALRALEDRIAALEVEAQRRREGEAEAKLILEASMACVLQAATDFCISDPRIEKLREHLALRDELSEKRENTL